MRMTRSTSTANKTGVVVLTGDPAFEQLARTTFTASAQIDLRVISGTVSGVADKFNTEGVTVVIIDVDASREEDMQALERLMGRIGHWPPVIAVTQSFDADVARRLLQTRVADFLVKPVQPVELVRTCARVARPAGTDTTEAQIYTFL